MSLIMWCALRCAFKFLHEKKNIVMDATWFNGSKTLPITSKKRKEICCLFTGLVRFWWSIGDDHRREVFVKEVHQWKPFGEWWSWQAWQYQSMTSLTFRSFCSLPKTIIIIKPKKYNLLKRWNKVSKHIFLGMKMRFNIVAFGGVDVFTHSAHHCYIGCTPIRWTNKCVIRLTNKYVIR